MRSKALHQKSSDTISKMYLAMQEKRAMKTFKMIKTASQALLNGSRRLCIQEDEKLDGEA